MNFENEVKFATDLEGGRGLAKSYLKGAMSRLPPTGPADSAPRIAPPVVIEWRGNGMNYIPYK